MPSDANPPDSSCRVEDVGEFAVTEHDTEPSGEAVQERIVWTHGRTGVDVVVQVLRTFCTLRVEHQAADVTLSLGYPMARRDALQSAREWMADHPRGDPPALAEREEVEA